VFNGLLVTRSGNVPDDNIEFGIYLCKLLIPLCFEIVPNLSIFQAVDPTIDSAIVVRLVIWLV
jgi:hypothetical protein